MAKKGYVSPVGLFLVLLMAIFWNSIGSYLIGTLFGYLHGIYGHNKSKYYFLIPGIFISALLFSYPRIPTDNLLFIFSSIVICLANSYAGFMLFGIQWDIKKTIIIMMLVFIFPIILYHDWLLPIFIR